MEEVTIEHLSCMLFQSGYFKAVVVLIYTFVAAGNLSQISTTAAPFTCTVLYPHYPVILDSGHSRGLLKFIPQFELRIAAHTDPEGDNNRILFFQLKKFLYGLVL